jgi:hypothetical protein
MNREGGRHSIYANPANGAKAPVPGHAEIRQSSGAKDLPTACDQTNPLTAAASTGSADGRTTQSSSFPERDIGPIGGNNSYELGVYGKP